MSGAVLGRVALATVQVGLGASLSASNPDISSQAMACHKVTSRAQMRFTSGQSVSLPVSGSSA